MSGKFSRSQLRSRSADFSARSAPFSAPLTLRSLFARVHGAINARVALDGKQALLIFSEFEINILCIYGFVYNYKL